MSTAQRRFIPAGSGLLPHTPCGRWPYEMVRKSQVLYASTNRFVAGTILRFATWASGDADITIDTVSGSTGIIPASRLLITGIATL